MTPNKPTPEKRATPRTDAFCFGKILPLANNFIKREEFEKVVGCLKDVLTHRHEDKDANHVMWVGETTFLLCEQALSRAEAILKK